MLTVSNIHTYYGASQALFGLSMVIDYGEVVTLLGRNGMGKTTSVHSIMGITRVSSGEIHFQNQRIDDKPSFIISRSGIGLVPEGRQIFPNLSVIENLLATAANRGKQLTPWTIEAVLEMFPLLQMRLHNMGNLLSGGEQQMLAIGRALMTNPKLLILDEATEGLAPLIRSKIWACIKKLKKEGMAILIIDKNINDLTKIADKHYIIEKGQITWYGSNAEFLTHRDVLGKKLEI
jgi:branched-chain amino acid transport system ATP-binding protein